MTAFSWAVSFVSFVNSQNTLSPELAFMNPLLFYSVRL